MVGKSNFTLKKIFSYIDHNGIEVEVPPRKMSKMVEQAISLIPKKLVLNIHSVNW